eukprot:SAG22_NODE_1512_length_4256_cov_2.793120_1_plen_227_part_00
MLVAGGAGGPGAPPPASPRYNGAGQQQQTLSRQYSAPQPQPSQQQPHSIHSHIDELAGIASAAAHKMLEHDCPDGPLLADLKGQVERRVGAEQAAMRAEISELKEELRRLGARSVSEDRLARSEVQIFEHRHLIESMRTTSKELLTDAESAADHIHTVSSLVHEVNARLARAESMLGEQRRMIEKERNLIDEERHARGLQYEQLLARMNAVSSSAEMQTASLFSEA